MVFSDWLGSLVRRPGPRDDPVLYYDVPSRRVVRIPAAELHRECVPTCVAPPTRDGPVDRVVWLVPEDLGGGEVRHPPFGEAVRSYVRVIHATFAVRRPMSFDDWELAFRRSANPSRDIAVWSQAAEVYERFAAGEPSASRRAEAYALIVACLTLPAELVTGAVRPRALPRREAERIVRSFVRSCGEPRPGGVLPLPSAPAPLPTPSAGGAAARSASRRRGPRPQPRPLRPGRSPYERLWTCLAGLFIAAFIAFFVTVLGSTVDADAPSPERVLGVLLAYTGCAAAGIVIVAVVLHWLGRVAGRRPRHGPPPSPPPERSPSGLPIGPRRPPSLVAHARPPGDASEGLATYGVAGGTVVAAGVLP